MNTSFFPGFRSALLTCAGLTALLAGGCSDDDNDGADGAPSASTGESTASTGADGAELSADALFSERGKGEWLAQIALEGPDGTAYIDSAITFDPATHRRYMVVQAFADEARTIPLLTYDAVFDYEVVGLSPTLEDVFEITFEDTKATITAHVDPAAFAGFGLDDCPLVLDEAVDVTGSACPAPALPDGSCRYLDIYRIADAGEEMFTSTAESRCVAPPTEIDPDFSYWLVTREVPAGP